MAANGFDVDAYLRRISYDGPREPTLAVLTAIVAAHTQTIPYENIDVLLKRGASLDIEDLRQKLINRGRGGYCFEQNTLLGAALDALGFAVTRLAARVVRGLPTGAPSARAHKLLRVDVAEGSQFVDVGFGNLTPTAPLGFLLEHVQETPHEQFRLMPQANELVLQARLGDAWDNLFRFSLEPAPAIDFQMANWFTSTFPSAFFLNHLIAARPVPGGRMTVYNRRFTIRDRNNRTTRRVLYGMDDYRDVLVGKFGLMLDDGELAAIAAEMASHPADEEVHRAFV